LITDIWVKKQVFAQHFNVPQEYIGKDGHNAPFLNLERVGNYSVIFVWERKMRICTVCVYIKKGKFYWQIVKEEV
jgi:hypothetical protein